MRYVYKAFNRKKEAESDLPAQLRTSFSCDMCQLQQLLPRQDQEAFERGPRVVACGCRANAVGDEAVHSHGICFRRNIILTTNVTDMLHDRYH